jgi:hypothetical protein
VIGKNQALTMLKKNSTPTIDHVTQANPVFWSENIASFSFGFRKKNKVDTRTKTLEPNWRPAVGWTPNRTRKNIIRLFTTKANRKANASLSHFNGITFKALTTRYAANHTNPKSIKSKIAPSKII